MFLQEFQQQLPSTRQIKKTKKEYSAGFRNYHPNKHSPFQDQSQNTQAQSDIFDQLKIGNLKELYQQSQPIISHQKEIVQHQQKSVLRLISRPQKKPNEQSQKQEDKELKDQPKFTDAYHKVANFEQSANTTLFKSQLKKIECKLKKHFKEKSSSSDFLASIINFILVKQKVLAQRSLHFDNLAIEYTNFINQHHLHQKQPKLTIEKSILESILKKHLFLYSTFKMSLIQQQNNQQTLRGIVRNQEQIMKLIISNDSTAVELLNKKYTVPYQSQPHKLNLSSNQQILIKPEQSQRYIFHANSIPESTYKPPKERPKSSVKAKTVVDPFNLTDNNKKEQKKMEDYYKWQRNFKPRQIPKTTYEPQQVVLADQADKKKRAAQLLRSAAFPATMKYLENYNQYSQGKEEQLKNKYWKNHQNLITSDKIPDFQQIHTQQIVNLQTRKSENRHITKPQPFKLSQSRPKKQQQIYEHPVQNTQQLEIEPKKVKKSTFVPQSTLKYQAYVKHIKSEKEQKEKAADELKKKAVKQQGQKRILKDILKERIDLELNNIPKNNINPQSLTSNSVKVNLQKIYSNEPLLIEREAAKSKKTPITHQKDWAPII